MKITGHVKDIKSVIKGPYANLKWRATIENAGKIEGDIQSLRMFIKHVFDEGIVCRIDISIKNPPIYLQFDNERPDFICDALAIFDQQHVAFMAVPDEISFHAEHLSTILDMCPSDREISLSMDRLKE